MSSNSAANKTSVFYWVHWAITIFFLFIFGRVICFPGLEPMGMQVLGCLLGMLWGWATLGFIAPSMLALVAFGFSEYCANVTTAFNGMFSNSTVQFVVLIFVFTAYIESAGLSKKIADWFLTRSINIGRPYMWLFLLLTANFILVITTSIVSAMLLVWSIMYAVFEELGYEKGEAFPHFAIFGVGATTLLAANAVPWRVTPLMLIAGLESVSEGAYTMTFNQIFSVCCPVFFIMTAAYIPMVKYLAKPDTSKYMKLDEAYFAEIRKNLGLTKQEKLAAFFLALFIIVLVGSSFIPKGTFLQNMITRLGASGPGLIGLLLVLIMIVRVDGKPILDYEKMAAQGTSWSTLWMFGSSLPIAGALSSTDAGVTRWIAGYLAPALEGQSMFMFCLIISVTVTLLTQIAHNVAVALVGMTLMYPFAISMGLSVDAIAIMICFACAIAWATPAASTMAAMNFANDWCQVGRCYGWGTLYTIICVIIMMTLGYGWAVFLYA